jgi:hypothetical protein
MEFLSGVRPGISLYIAHNQIPTLRCGRHVHAGQEQVDVADALAPDRGQESLVA